MGATRIRLILAAALLVPILLYWGAGNTPSERLSGTAADAGIDSFMKDATVVKYDQTGKVQQALHASSIEHRQNTNYFTAPSLQRNLADSGQMSIHARQGQMDDNQQQLDLLGKVELYNKPATGETQQLSSERMTYYPQHHQAETSAPVAFLTPGHRITAVGLKADLAKGQIDLLSEVKGLHNNEK